MIEGKVVQRQAGSGFSFVSPSRQDATEKWLEHFRASEYRSSSALVFHPAGCQGVAVNPSGSEVSPAR
jgi:hypothetical protein